MAHSETLTSSLPVETLRPARVRNRAYHHVGQAILALNKIRHEIQGYRTPRLFPVTEIGTAIAYDHDVVRKWLRAYRAYAGDAASFEGKNVLELGPGADLGVGLLLLADGARSYHAIDVNNLVTSAPAALYEALFARMDRQGTPAETIADLRAQLDPSRRGADDRLDYVCRKDFDIRVFRGKDIDLVVSHAAFEHFDDVDTVIAQTSEVVRPGAVLVAEIDLQTHTRWIRNADPLNIYRYSAAFYRLFRFLGSPNRMRPYEYRETLARHGWTDVRIYPVIEVDDAHVARVRPALNARFRPERCEMQVLDMVVCATKA